MNWKILLGAVVLIAAAVFVWSRYPSGTAGGEALAMVEVPNLSPEIAGAKTVFDENCASCHGPNGSGRNGLGPPLVHRIYEPGHHGDMAFVLAAQRGVVQHHWSFGNMPPQPHVSERDLIKIIAYIRTLQRHNGIE